MNKSLAYFLMIASFIFLILNVAQIDFNNFKNNNYYNISSNILIIILMIHNILALNKKKNSKHE